MYGYPEAGLNPSVFGDAVLGCLTAVSAATDLYCGRVYNFVTVPGLCAGILLAIHRSGAAGLLDVLCAAGVLPGRRAGRRRHQASGSCLRLYAGRRVSQMLRRSIYHWCVHRDRTSDSDRRQGAQGAFCCAGCCQCAAAFCRNVLTGSIEVCGALQPKPPLILQRNCRHERRVFHVAYILLMDAAPACGMSERMKGRRHGRTNYEKRHIDRGL